MSQTSHFTLYFIASSLQNFVFYIIFPYSSNSSKSLPLHCTPLFSIHLFLYSCTTPLLHSSNSSTPLFLYSSTLHASIPLLCSSAPLLLPPLFLRSSIPLLLYSSTPPFLYSSTALLLYSLFSALPLCKPLFLCISTSLLYSCNPLFL